MLTTSCIEHTDMRTLKLLYVFRLHQPDRTTALLSDSDVNVVLSLCRNKVLNISSGLDEPGEFNWELILCLMAVWVMVYFCVWKGVKSTGKVTYMHPSFRMFLCIFYIVPGRVTQQNEHFSPFMLHKQRLTVLVCSQVCVPIT